MPADTEVAGLSVVVSAEVAQAMKALEGMSKQFEDTSLVAQQATDIQEASFVEVEKGLKDSAKAHEKHNKGILEGLKKNKLAWAAMGAAVTGAMYGIVRSSSYGELYMARFSSITQQAKDAIMTRYGLVGALDDLGNAYQAYVSGSKDGIDTTKDAISWWFKASGGLKVLTFLMGVGVVAGLAKAGAALVAFIGWGPILIAGLGAVTIYMMDYIARTLKLQKVTDDLSHSWSKFKENMGNGKYLKAAKDAVSEFIGWMTSTEQWIPSAGSPITKFFDPSKFDIAIIAHGKSMMDGIKKFLRITPGYLTSEFVTNINKGIKWLDAAVKIKYGGLVNWSATFVDQIKEWGSKKWQDFIDWTSTVDIWNYITGWGGEEGGDRKNIWDFINDTKKSIWDWITGWSGDTKKDATDFINETSTSIWNYLNEEDDTGTKKDVTDIVDTDKKMSIWEIITWPFRSIFDYITGSPMTINEGATKSIWDIIIWSKISIWGYIDTSTKSIWDWFTTETKSVFDWIDTSTKSIWDWFTTETKSVFDWIDTSTKSIWDWIDTSVHPLWSSLIDWTGGFWDTLKAAGGAAKTAWEGLVNWTSSTFWSNVTQGTSPSSGGGTGSGGSGNGSGDTGGYWVQNNDLSMAEKNSLAEQYMNGDITKDEYFNATHTWVPGNSNTDNGETSPDEVPPIPEGTIVLASPYHHHANTGWSIERENDTGSWEQYTMLGSLMEAIGGKNILQSVFDSFNEQQQQNFMDSHGAIIDDTTHELTQQYAMGGYVPYDMNADIHRGEYVVPRGGTLVKEGGMPDVTINLTVNNGTQKDSRALADEISRILSTEIRRLVKT